MPFATPIVPMPRWSTPIGCTKLFLTIVVLAFVAACTAIWGWYPAFGISIFTASLSLVTFGYYLVALSFKPALYNKWLILSLETLLTLLWFVSLILLAGWTGASSATPRYYYNLSPYPTAYGSTVDLSGRSYHRRDVMYPSWQSSGMCKRQGLDVPRTMVRVHGMSAHWTAQILAGIAAGLAGMVFIMYGTTLATFAMNFHSTTAETSASDPAAPPTTTHDEESQTQAQSEARSSRSNTTPTTTTGLNSNPVHPQIQPTTTPPSLTEPLRVNTLPKDFEPHPQKQEYYSTPEEASEAGIEPPTPLLRAMTAEGKIGKLGIEKGVGVGIGETSPVSSLDVEGIVDAGVERRQDATREREKVKGDGKVEREV